MNGTTVGQVMIMDYNNDLLPDLLGQVYIEEYAGGQNDTIVLRRQVWVNDKHKPGIY